MMQEILQFIISHWALWTALLVIVILLLHMETNPRVAGTQLVSTQEMTRLINKEDATVIDIRDDDAFKAGHITSAIHIPSSDIDKHYKKLQKFKEKPIIITCQNGQQSPKTGAQLRRQDFTKVYALKGGITAWQQANLPLVKSNPI